VARDIEKSQEDRDKQLEEYLEFRGNLVNVLSNSTEISAADVEKSRNDQREKVEMEVEAGKYTNDPFKTIFIGRLPEDIGENEVRAAFERYGHVKSVKLIRKPSGHFRRYGFVEYSDERDARGIRLSLLFLTYNYKQLT
jgi:RNA recognition motif-containing protein